ncbi:transcription initiation factor TFIID subunit 11-like [Nematostella vectensis]|uniref:transcription initiation factor TFIID subunit 11-like n=1 Tax=Nematostella vectensis TaxID=45351 RepID=UPI0020771BEE|nr:transcription initiation factor TFIID subunit 11-like [Nematostella vectensis]
MAYDIRSNILGLIFRTISDKALQYLLRPQNVQEWLSIMFKRKAVFLLLLAYAATVAPESRLPSAKNQFDQQDGELLKLREDEQAVNDEDGRFLDEDNVLDGTPHMDFQSKEEASQSQTVNEDNVPTTNDDDEDKASTTNDDDQDKASTTNDNKEVEEIEKNPPVEPAEYTISEDKREDMFRQIIKEERTPSTDEDDGDYEEPDDDQPVHPSHYSVPEDEITSANEDEDDDKDEKEDEDELE